MDTRIDFLTKPTPERLRKEIINICDSYSHPWDVLAELCQNAVDAVRKHLKVYGEAAKKHEIIITLDAIDRIVSVRDSGVGFSFANFASLLGPNGTDKDPDDFLSIGQKGVGLTYAIFSSEMLVVDTQSIDGRLKGHVKGAVLWKNNKIDDIPQFDPELHAQEHHKPEDTYTEITAKGVESLFDEDEDLFNQTPEIIEFILRTRTAIGSTRPIWNAGEKENFKVTLLFRNNENKKFTRDIEPLFMLPEYFLASNACVDYEDFVKLAAGLDDRQKTIKLQRKCLKVKGSQTRNGRDIKYYAFFAHSRKFWTDLSKSNKLVKYNQDLKDDDPLYTSGIFVSSRNMPTGITLTPPSTGEAAYWGNIFVLLEDNRIIFDLGRKSVPGRTQWLLKDIAREVFNDFIKYRKYITTDPETQTTISAVQIYEKNAIFAELEKLPSINIDSICFLKHPDSQEAAVVAIFHELLGAKILRGYECLKHGYKETYDFWGYYTVHKDITGSNVNITDGTRLPIIIEYKYSCEDILIDFQKRIKYFLDVDLVICWDFDEKKFSKEGIQVKPLKKEDVLFHGSNFELEWPGSYNLGPASKKQVLSLRRFIESYHSST